MKSPFIAVLFLCVISCTAFGQTPNAQAIKIETPEIVAEVNGDKISRSSLAAECLELHGENELQELIGNTLIRMECERQKITITGVEINAEILQMAQTWKMSSEELLQTFEKRYGRPAEDYRYTVWRMLALGKLAGQRLVITDEELQTEYEKRYGAAVKVRQIVLATRAEAEAVLTQVRQHPESFAAVAKNQSVDPVTQPLGGALHPIRRHSYNPNVENLLFAMKEGDISPVVEFPLKHFSIYKCEEHLQPVDVDFATVRQALKLQIRDAKLPQVANDVFQELQRQTKVQIVRDNPALYSKYPGVAAVLNEQTLISQQELAESCIRKHGKDVLGDMINRRIVEQACKREGIIISEQDIDNEIREMAFKYLPLLPNGNANIELWLKRGTEESGLSIPMYRKNIVVPMLSLKRLTRKQVEVTEKEIQLAYEANFGQKVRCLAIFFDATQQRRAMEVWNMANNHKTEEAFRDLAEQYSYDPESRMGKGAIPPIARHCGHPELEDAAFSLKPNEISHIIQIEEALVILYCVGYVDPLPVKPEEVRTDLIADIFEKKQQMLVSECFDKLREKMIFDNYLTGESRNPDLENALKQETDPIR
ncbi:MAG: peptidylprolyl isomerase [Planctomycetaceae bacterium]|nr:peptidylprolyl isomerase [Planctomycetaceae bacterium]